MSKLVQVVHTCAMQADNMGEVISILNTVLVIVFQDAQSMKPGHATIVKELFEYQTRLLADMVNTCIPGPGPGRN